MAPETRSNSNSVKSYDRRKKGERTYLHILYAYILHEVCFFVPVFVENRYLLSRRERERERDLETLLSPRVRSLDLYTRALARALGLHLCARVLDASHPHCDIFPACLYLFAKLPLPLPLFLIPAHSKISRERKFLRENRTEIIIPSTIPRNWTVNREGVNERERENYSWHVLFLETI